MNLKLKEWKDGFIDFLISKDWKCTYYTTERKRFQLKSVRITIDYDQDEFELYTGYVYKWIKCRSNYGKVLKKIHQQLENNLKNTIAESEKQLAELNEWKMEDE